MMKTQLNALPLKRSLLQKRIVKIPVFVSLLMCSCLLYGAPLKVFVSILPQQFLLQQIGGDRVEVTVMVKPGQSPATFEPSPKTMASYSVSDAYFAIGMPFEQVWLKRLASLNSGLAIVQTQPAQKVLISAHDSEHDFNRYSKTHAGHHHHGVDPHTWLSPVLFKEQARIVHAALVHLAPQDSAYFDSNYQKLEARLESLHKDLSAIFADKKARRFVTFHPAFSYFAKQYGLTQIAIEVNGKEPSAKQMAGLVERLRPLGVHYLLLEKQFNQVIPQTVAQSINAQVLMVDPLSADYLVNMRQIATNIAKALF